MIKSYAPNKQAIVVRNPNFDASQFDGNVPAGNPDKMTVDIIGDDTVALQRVISGQDDYDFHQLPPDRLARRSRSTATRSRSTRRRTRTTSS